MTKLETRLDNILLKLEVPTETTEQPAKKEKQAPPSSSVYTSTPKLDHSLDPSLPDWIQERSEQLRAGQVAHLTAQETDFWKSLLKKYLAPAERDEEHEARLKAELIELRNVCALTLLIVNVFAMTIVFFLQINPDVHIAWPLDTSVNLTPIAFVFILLYVSILLVQIVGMIFHRLGTLMHIMAATRLELTCCSRRDAPSSGEADLQANGVQYVKRLQQLRGVDSITPPDDDARRPAGGAAVAHAGLQRRRQKTVKYEEAFIKRLEHLPDVDNMAPTAGSVKISRELTINKSTAFAMSVKRRSVKQPARITLSTTASNLPV
ncbi:PREDICTED: uncharacterized protein LOC106806878 [Priapulus caudatus]|uniref:Uncharacterized protein LOC106806878 n=1 Tax=Priapulus caudatus TaxID=37621 RepID=A0ABM1DX32_PRICU|nr:PREDICTED: uncharacterized protein LOC106806878 [Priapulus caudatus]